MNADIKLVDKHTGEMFETEDELCIFSSFWLLYPRRVARKDAERAWLKLQPEQRMQAIIAMADWRRVWADKDLDYLPHAATWLNGWRFEDELPCAYTQSSSSHRPAAIPEPGKRSVMPDAVRALLASLKKK